MTPTERLTPEGLFERFFLPLYPADARLDLQGARNRDANPGNNPSILHQLKETASVFAALAPKALVREDLDLDFSDASVHRLGRALTRELRDSLLLPQEEGATALIVPLVVHGALYLGECVARQHGGTWQVRRPLWESLVRLESRQGTGDLALFHWWLKALSDDEIDSPRLADRYRTHVEVPRLRTEELLPIASPDRRLPRLQQVRYDTLHKYLRAHVPELRDVGADFPSAERLDELHFQWLDFVWVGEGRNLILHGPSQDGVHLMWLDRGGFTKSVYYPADAFPAHKVELDGEKVRVLVPVLGRLQVHEMLWWGP